MMGIDEAISRLESWAETHERISRMAVKESDERHHSNAALNYRDIVRLLEEHKERE